MKKYKGIIFDLDGTLLNTIEDIGDSMNEVLRKFNLSTYSYDEYKRKVGEGFKKLTIRSFPLGTDENTIDIALKMLIETYGKKYLNKTKPYDGIHELLELLDKRNVKLAVNSNKRNEYTKNLIYKFFDDIPFVKIYGEREGIKIKPDPTSALEIAECMGLSPDEILFIGDSKTDILTAKNAHMDSVGVLWGFRGREELEANGAKYIVSSWEEILDLV